MSTQKQWAFQRLLEISERAREEQGSDLLAQIVNSSDDAIVSKNLDGIITSWNKSAQRIFGYTAEEAIGQSIHLIIPKDRSSEEATIIERIRRGEHVDHFETVRQRKDGTLVHVSVTISPVKDASGSIIGASKVARDITEQKRAEEAIRQHRDRFDMVAETTEVGFWFCDLPFDKLVWDRRVKEHFWLPPDADVSIDTFYERLHPDDRERTRQTISDTIANDTRFDTEYRTVSPDGRIKWIRAVGRPFYDSNHNPIRFDGLTLDITGAKQARDRERASAEEVIAATAKFKAIFEQTTVFAGIMTKEGILIEANRLSLEGCGFRAEEVLGKPFWQTAWWQGNPEAQKKIREAIPLVAQGKPYRETLTYGWADGTSRITDFALYPIVNDRGEVVFLHPTGVDITDLKRAEEQSRKLNETLDAEVRLRTRELEQRNHEVLLQSEQLRAFSQRLLQAQDDERRRIARDLHDSAGQLVAALAMNLSVVSESQKMTDADPRIVRQIAECHQLVQLLNSEIRTISYLLHPPLLEEIGLLEAVRWYVDGLKERSGIDITLEVGDGLGRFPADVELVVFRLIQECLTNIHRHSGSSTARISLDRSNGNFILKIQDQGKGISAERLAQLQLGSSGVGMRGMRERVHQLGGEMKLESDGKGTTVSFEFPEPAPPKK